jgi:H+/Na+-translocating ferredoxin:NAD+ oxidoreductase subunit B
MSQAVYQELSRVLDALPNGFPPTESGIEIRLLEKIFRPEDAVLFCDLRLQFETAEQISERTGRPFDGLEDHLVEMQNRGQVFGVDIGGVRLFKMIPWAFGIYEFQVAHMDRELAEMCEAYSQVYGKAFFSRKPQLMQVIPVEKEIPGKQQALAYEQVSTIIESSQAFSVFDCVCKKEKHLLDQGCEKPLEVCMAFAPIPGVFDNIPHHRTLTRDEAYALLDKAEAAGLVHLTWNMESDHFFICNCCGCCCGVLRAVNELGIDAANVINSYYFARIDADLCVACGVCRDERCQVNAIEEKEDVYAIIREKCIGCGLCVSTCPSEAISLVRKSIEEIDLPPKNEMDWYEKHAASRGIDIAPFK